MPQECLLQMYERRNTLSRANLLFFKRQHAGFSLFYNFFFFFSFQYVKELRPRTARGSGTHRPGQGQVDNIGWNYLDSFSTTNHPSASTALKPSLRKFVPAPSAALLPGLKFLNSPPATEITVVSRS